MVRKWLQMILIGGCALSFAGGGTLLGIGIAEKVKNEPFAYSEKNCDRFFEENDLFHDQAAEYVSSYEPKKEENVTLRLKIRHASANQASILYSFDYGETSPSYLRAPMSFEKVDSSGAYDYWIGAIPANAAPYQYEFEVKNRRDDVLYNKDGLSALDSASSSGDWAVLPDFSTPLWSQGATWYSLMPESFYNGNTLNDKTGSGNDTPWGGHNSWAGEWFSGDLAGVSEKEDYLANTLNVTSLFLNPIWVTAHNAGYGCYDFFQIDSALGNDLDLLSLVSSLHSDQLKIMLDAVFQYCNVNNILNNISKLYPDLYGESFADFLQRYLNGTTIDSEWGGALIDFSKLITREYLYSSEQSVLISYILLFGIDAWRMDVGNTLSGTTPGNWDTASQILADIRTYLKSASENVLFLSEHADSDQLRNGILDSKWNYAFYHPLLDWCNNDSNAKVLADGLETAVLSYPRGVSNSLYNFLTTHDLPYFYDLIGQDKNSFLAAETLLMTFVGSPCLYFGEETGAKASKLTDSGTMTNSFYTSMNWDESSYDYDIFNRVRALCKLRADYSEVFKTGGYMNLFSDTQNNPQDVFGFARFSEQDVCVSLINRQDETAEGIALDLSRLGLADGSVLTDYLSNRSYSITDGKTVVDVLPGGAILTTGKKTKGFVSELALDSKNEQTSIQKIGDSSFLLEGKSSLEDASFAYAEGFGNSRIDVLTEKGNADSSYGILLKEDGTGSLAYGVLRMGNEIQSVSNNGNGFSYGERQSIAPGSMVSVLRGDYGECQVLVDGFVLSSLTKTMGFSYRVRAGISPLGGESVIQLKTSALQEQIGADFSKGLSSGMFVLGSQDNVAEENGRLALKGMPKTLLLSPSHGGDMTEKAVVSSSLTEKGFAGLCFAQSADDTVFLGAYHDGQQTRLALGHDIKGQLAVYGAIALPKGNITLQLEKVGTTYRGVVLRSDGGVEEIGVLRNVNYSEFYGGLLNNSSATLYAKEWCYGNGLSKKAYSYHGALDFSFSSYLSSQLSLQYAIKSGNGFSYVPGGIAQKNESDKDTIYAMANPVGDFGATFSFKPLSFSPDGSSYLGFSFDNSAADKIDGLQFRLYASGKLTLTDGAGTLLKESTLSDFSLGKLRLFQLKVSGSFVHLYSGNEENLVLSYENRETTQGYFSWNSTGSAYELHSYNIYKESGNYAAYEGALYGSEKNGDYSLELSGNESVNYAGFRDLGLSSFVLGFNLQLLRENVLSHGYFDLLLGVDAGHYYLSGLALRIDEKGRLSVFEDGQATTENQTTSIQDVSSVYLLVVYQKSTLKVYSVNYQESGSYSSDSYQLQLTYHPSKAYGGALSFYSKNAGVQLNHIKGNAISDDEDITALPPYQNIVLNEPIPANGVVPSTPASEIYRNDFSSNKDLASLDRYSGQSQIDDGHLIINGETPLNWNAGAALCTGTYTSFDLHTRVKVEKNGTGGSFAAVEFYKSAPSLNHQASALTIVIYPGGTALLFVGNGIATSYQVTGSPDEEGYVVLSLSVKNGQISFSLGGSPLIVSIASLPNNNSLTGGYLSLNAGANIATFDYVDVTPTV